MTPEFAIQLVRQALMTTFWLSAPLLALAFAVGIIFSLIQIVTSIQDSVFSTVPRLAAFLFGFLFMMPWMLKQITSYTILLLGDLGRYAR